VEKKTLAEWEEEYNIEILDPDGFNRRDPYLYHRKYTREQFLRGLSLSTIMGTREVMPWIRSNESRG